MVHLTHSVFLVELKVTLCKYILHLLFSIVKQCILPPLPNMVDLVSSVAPDESVTMTCGEDYRIKGESTLTCREDGTFDLAYPVCECK